MFAESNHHVVHVIVFIGVEIYRARFLFFSTNMLRTVCNLAISCSRVAPIRARWLHAGSTHWQQGVPATLDCGHVVVVSEDRRKITLVCEGEQKRRFHGKWLRHNCRCPVCTSVHTGQTIVDPKDLANDLKIEFADISGINN